MDFVIHNANAVTSSGLLECISIGIEDGMIAKIREGHLSNGGRSVDAGGRHILPGFIDMHSDAIEKEIEPRPGAVFPIDVAIFELDKRLASCGVTTMYHSLSFAENDLGIRSNKGASDIAMRITDLAASLKVRTKIHARYEVTDTTAFPFIEALVQDRRIDLLSVMDHTPGQGQFKELISFKNYYGRVYLKNEEELERIINNKLHAKEHYGDEGLKSIISLCKDHEIPLASHDDDTVEKIEWLVEQGITISEFPVTLEAAMAASQRGIAVCLGAPNILRGNSQTRNLSARQAISEGYGNVVCSDYSPMSLLHSVFTLEKCGLKTLHEAVNMVSLNPAIALGIAKYTGSIEEGKSADLVMADATGEVPLVVKTYVTGKEVYSTC